ncbi:hypothetical protein WJX73_001393 [Symbiochloris irregularis]|uniref:U-box domain-containing protein n=1 Tax=Symbiochloris irregularis TaxID=706552 RepID=A0AAW1PI13_9CHLO
MGNTSSSYPSHSHGHSISFGGQGYGPQQAGGVFGQASGGGGRPLNHSTTTRFRTISDNFHTLDQVQDALRRNGLESSQLIIGFDFTKSNEWTGKRSFGNRSLHDIRGTPNPYETAASIIGRTLAPFDDDNMIPCFGFGDMTTHDTGVFSFFPNEAPAQGLPQVVWRYRQIVPHISLSGPTSFAPLIHQAMRTTIASGMQYHICIIIADGQVTRSVDTAPGHLGPQEQATVNAIVAASNLPLSIIMVGVGDGPFDLMQEFDDALPARKFDNFQFVNFTQVMSDTAHAAPAQREALFALRALMEIPEQYKEIMPTPGGADMPDQMFICPITQDVMSVPVIAADGYTYEQSAIREWKLDPGAHTNGHNVKGSLANGNSAHANGKAPLAKSGSTKRGHAFNPSGDWRGRTPVDQDVYPRRRLSCSEEEWKARVDLAAAYRLCHRYGFNEGAVNHLTLRVPGTQDHFLVFPFGMMWNEVTASSLLVVNEAGKVISGEGEPEATAFWIHAPIHAQHPDANCIMHTHQPEITALCCLEDHGLPMLHQNCQFFYDDIALDTYNGLILDPSEGNHLVEAFGDKHVLLHQSHGPMVVGDSVSVTFYRLYFLEQAARVVNKAMALNRPLRIIPDHVCKEFMDVQKVTFPEYGRLFFEACKRQLLKTEDRDFCT